jgi:hypothetical protein
LDCQGLQSAVFEDGATIERIEAHAFDGCRFYSISIPSSVKFIGYAAFAWSPVRDTYYEGTFEEWEQIVKEEGLTNSSFEIKLHCTDQTISIK